MRFCTCLLFLRESSRRNKPGWQVEGGGENFPSSPVLKFQSSNEKSGCNADGGERLVPG